MKFFAALAVGAFVLGAMPAHATDASPAHPRVHTRVTGTYVVTTAPGSEVLGVFDTAGSVTWTFDASPSQRVLPATLTQATLGPFVTPCSDTGDGTVTETVAGPGVDAAAVLDFGIVADLLRGRTRATVRFLTAAGNVRFVTDQECTGAYSGGNGVTSEDVSAAPVAKGTAGDPWPMHLDGSGRWHIDGVQTQTAADGGGTTRAEVHAVLQGSLRDFRAICTIPTVKQLRKVRSFEQGAALLAKAGFGKPYTGVHHIRWAPRGHYYVDELGDTPYLPCGARLHLYRS